MPEISSNDIREWDDERLDNEINEAYRSLFTLRFQHATRQLENYRTLRTARRTIARLRTIKRERQLKENQVVYKIGKFPFIANSRVRGFPSFITSITHSSVEHNLESPEKRMSRAPNGGFGGKL